MNINDIKWPADKKDAVKHLVSFQLKVLERLEIDFGEYKHDPIFLVKSYIENEIIANDYGSQVDIWWGFLEKNDKLRDFQSRDALMARIAISLLSVKEEIVADIGDHLSWFLELIFMLDKDGGAVGMMKAYFKFDQKIE
ncbi:MAG: hypothetical protein AB8F95_14335 [Bacteroidia bacterium]